MKWSLLKHVFSILASRPGVHIKLLLVKVYTGNTETAEEILTALGSVCKLLIQQLRKELNLVHLHYISFLNLHYRSLINVLELNSFF